MVDKKIKTNEYQSGSIIAKAHYFIGNRIVIRLLSFILNIFVLRKINRDVYSFTEFCTFYGYVLFLDICREGFRMASIRFKKKNDKNSIKSISNTFKILFLCDILLSIFVYFGIRKILKITSNDQLFALKIFLLSALIEILSEPIYIYYNLKAKFDVQIKSEISSNFFKFFISLLFHIFSFNSVIYFSFVNLFYAITISSAYYLIFFKRESIEIKKTILNITNWKINMSILNETAKFTGNNFFQLISDNLANLYIASINIDRSSVNFVFAVGSIIRKIYFEPIEDALFKEFNLIFRNSNSSLEKLRFCFIKVAKINILISFMGIIFGPFLSRPLIFIIYGNKWLIGNSDKLLNLFCFYLLLLCFSSISNKTLIGTAPSNKMNKTNMVILFTSIFTSIISVILTILFKTNGVLYGACLSEIIRIFIFSIQIKENINIKMLIWFKNSFFSQRTILIFVISYFLLNFSYEYFDVFNTDNYIDLLLTYAFKCAIPHFIITGFCVLAIFASFWGNDYMS